MWFSLLRLLFSSLKLCLLSLLLFSLGLFAFQCTWRSFPHITSLLFIYIMGGLNERRNDCVQRKGITRIYIYISMWVAFNKAKYSPAFVVALVFHVFIFHALQNMLRLCTGLFYVLSSDWMERHGLHDTFQKRLWSKRRMNWMPNSQIFASGILQNFLRSSETSDNNV